MVSIIIPVFFLFQEKQEFLFSKPQAQSLMRFLLELVLSVLDSCSVSMF